MLNKQYGTSAIFTHSSMCGTTSYQEVFIQNGGRTPKRRREITQFINLKILLWGEVNFKTAYDRNGVENCFELLFRAEGNPIMTWGENPSFIKF